MTEPAIHMRWRLPQAAPKRMHPARRSAGWLQLRPLPIRKLSNPPTNCILPAPLPCRRWRRVRSRPISPSFLTAPTKPERADFLDGDAALNAVGVQLQQKDYPVKFPDVSSVKLIRRGRLSCSNSKCSVELLPPESMNAGEIAPAAAKQ